jgi:nitroreductase
MDQGLPDAYTVKAAIALATRAPSVHNSQPWLWRFHGRTVELHADLHRHLRHADPEGRDLLISCGCALHHFQVAAAALGWAAQIRRLPDPRDPDLLATIELVPHDTRDADIALSAAIPRRRSDRRRYDDRPITPRDHVFLVQSAAVHGGVLRTIGERPNRAALVTAAAEARGLHHADPDYRIELAAWSGRRYGPDGVPAQNALAATATALDLAPREFAEPLLADAAGPATDGATLAVLATAGDDRLDWLRAGEAASAVALTATQLGLASCLVTEPLELVSTRGLIQYCVLDGAQEPQLVLRLGYLPEGTSPLPATPRRPLGEVVQLAAHPYGVGLPIPAQLRPH